MATERPILFSAPMVLAILAGRKTQTRRIVKPQPNPEYTELSIDHPYGKPLLCYSSFPGKGTVRRAFCECPFDVGMRLWVREAYWKRLGLHADGFAGYVADFPEKPVRAIKKIPSILSPRWASRITLEITGVQVERLQDISEADAKAEGAFECDLPDNPDAEWPRGTYGYVMHDDGKNTIHPKAVGAYQELWNKINGPDSWAANPWVWCISFKRVK